MLILGLSSPKSNHLKMVRLCVKVFSVTLIRFKSVFLKGAKTHFIVDSTLNVVH